MASLVISHVIGTVALISIFLVAGIYNAFYFSLIQKDIIISKLGDIANYVSYTATELISLSTLSSQDQLLIKDIEIPKYIGNNIYILVIERSLDPLTEEEIIRVRTYLAFQSSTYAMSYLPWSNEGNIRIYNGTDPEILDILNDRLVNPKLSLSSGSENLVIWSIKRDSEIVIGLGEKMGG